MALLPYCPLGKPASFLPRKGNIAPEHFTRRALEDYSDRLKQFWEKLADTRLRTAEAIKKFSEKNTDELAKKWENWDEETIDSFRVQFQVIDLNQDGLIDFKELCKMLDDIGDTSSYEERKCYFDEVDADRSEGIDFEEFLQLMHQVETGIVSPERGLGIVLINAVQSGSMGSAERIGMACSTSGQTQAIIRIRHFSLQQLLQAGLF